MDRPRQPTVRQPDTGRVVSVVGDVYRLLVSGAETDGRYAAFDALVLPGGGPPPHIHHREEECFFVIEGEVTFQIGDQRIIAGPGTFANMAVGTPHAFKNESPRPARMLVTVAPAGFEKMFFECGTELPSGSTTPVPVTPQEIERLLAVAPKYGVEILPPPNQAKL